MTTHQFSVSGERDALCGFLDKQRAGLLRKIEGVSDADARRTPTASSLSLPGLLNHSALWERRWFQVIVAGRVLPGEWPATAEEGWIDEDFRVDKRDTAGHWAAYFEEQGPFHGRSPRACRWTLRARAPISRTRTCAGSCTT